MREGLGGGDERVLTLGALLDADPTTAGASEKDFVGLVQRIAARDASAIQALFQRAHAIVFTACLRITGRREIAEELTVDTFHDLWRRAASYDPAGGSVLGWIVNGARSRAIDRRRDPRESLDERERGRRLDAALAVLGAPRGSALGAHGPEHTQRVYAYALQALSGSELATAEANLSDCARCREELKWFRAVTDALVYWPTDVVRPPALLWDRVAQRILPEAREPSTGRAQSAWTDPEWKEIAPGISVKLLAIDAERQRISLLVRLAPEAHFPPHRHAGVEEVHLLYGELVVDDQKLLAGDYLRAEAGSADQLVWSETGCTCFVTTSTRDELG